MINIQFYENKDHYREVMSVREAVFIEEQGFSTDEDEIDNHCTHVLFNDDGLPFATGRVYLKDDKYILGRICVLKKYRGQGYGAAIIKELESKAKEQGATATHLGAQCVVKAFYEKLDYVEYGDIYHDEHCPHIYMQHKLI